MRPTNGSIGGSAAHSLQVTDAGSSKTDVDNLRLKGVTWSHASTADQSWWSEQTVAGKINPVPWFALVTSSQLSLSYRKTLQRIPMRA